MILVRKAPKEHYLHQNIWKWQRIGIIVRNLVTNKKNYSFCSSDQEITKKPAKSVVCNPYVTNKNPDTGEINAHDGSICTDVTSSTSTSAGPSTESPNASKSDALKKSWKDIAQHSSAKPRKNNKTSNNVTPPICSDKDVDRIDKSATDDEDVNSSNDELKTVGSINSVIGGISLHPDAEQDLKKKPYFDAADSIYKDSMNTNLNRVSFVGKCCKYRCYRDITLEVNIL